MMSAITWNIKQELLLSRGRGKFGQDFSQIQKDMDFKKDHRFRYTFQDIVVCHNERCFERSHLELVKNFSFFFFSGSVNVLWILRGSLEAQKAIPAHSQGRTCSKEALLEVPGEVNVKMCPLYSWKGKTGHFCVILSGQLGLETYEKRAMLWKMGAWMRFSTRVVARQCCCCQSELRERSPGQSPVGQAQVGHTSVGSISGWVRG